MNLALFNPLILVAFGIYNMATRDWFTACIDFLVALVAVYAILGMEAYYNAKR